MIYPGEEAYRSLTDIDFEVAWITSRDENVIIQHLVVGRIETFYDGGPHYGSYFERRVGPVTKIENARDAVAAGAVRLLGLNVAERRLGWFKRRLLRWLLRSLEPKGSRRHV